MALEAHPNFRPHLPEETLEKYAFGRLPGGAIAAVEEHLLICEHCCERLENEDDIAEAMQALAKLTAASARRWTAISPGLLKQRVE